MSDLRHEPDQLPVAWIGASVGSVVLQGPVAPVVSCLTTHCRLPIVGPLDATNISTIPSKPIRLRAMLQPVGCDSTVEIPSLAPGQRATIIVPPFRLATQSLRHISQATQGKLVIGVSPDVYEPLEYNIHILAAWDWPLTSDARPAIAAMVNPHDPAIEDIVAVSRQDLAALTGQPSPFYVLRSRCDSALLLTQALYAALGRARIHYVPPQLRFTGNPTIAYQTVLPPSQVLAVGGAMRATCIDASVLIASALESLGLQPLLAFLMDRDRRIYHAMCGCWVGTSPGPRALINRAFALSELDSGHLFILETTGPFQDSALAFDQALQRAQASLLDANDAFLIDIGACRAPGPDILPLDWPMDPIASAALEKARQFAVRKRRPLIEMSHLLAGLADAGGPVTSWLLHQAGVKCDGLFGQLDQLISGKDESLPPRESRNFSDCRRSAMEFAELDGRPVAEQHLWLALLTRASNSLKTMEVFRQVAVNISSLRSAMEQRFPLPGIDASADSILPAANPSTSSDCRHNS